ncbi:MAG: ABC transporter ATP-binding protein [Acidimicrobiia bacterium]
MDSPTLTPAATPPVLVCDGLRKEYGERLAVDGVGFSIAAGETYGLLGPNGAGKTTAISMVCGLLERDAGTVTVSGRSLDREQHAVKASIGYVPQEVAVYPDLTARENLRFFGRLYGLSRQLLTDRVEHALETVGLLDRADDRADSFSGGMKRRLNIAAGLLHEPQLLVLDEPTVGVDPQSRNAIFEAVTTLGVRGLAVLYTTHYMEEAERLCDRIGILDNGRFVAEGTRRELVALVGERGHIRLGATGDVTGLAEDCRRTDGVDEVTVREGGIDLLVGSARRLVARVLELAEQHDVAVQSVDLDEPDLEAVFLHLTGKALRD